MGKIVLLVPKEDMLQTAHNILQEKSYKILDMCVVNTEDTIVEARKAIADGATIIIARGLQASLIRQYTNIPVVQIVLTAQEMAILVLKAKQIVKKKIPTIAVVGFQNMFCDMSFFNELYGIELKTYYASKNEELLQEARNAAAAQVDLIIGGDTAVAVAKEYHIPSLFLSTTEDSLKQAFATAENMDYAMSVEKKSAAQIETLLDYSYNGVIRVDSKGVVLAVNQTMEQMVDIDQKDLIGNRISELVSQITEEMLNEVLTEGRENSIIIEWNQVALYTIFAPIIYDDRVDGALITFHRVQKSPAAKSGSHKTAASAMPPLVRFDDISQRSETMRECIRLAKLYAMSAHPVVLMGEAGTERRMIAESIHNAGNYSQGPFLDVPCAGLSEEQQKEMIFGEHGVVMQTQGGTLLIQDLENMTEANQYRLYQLIRFHVIFGTDIAQLRRADLRILVTVGKTLRELAQNGTLRQDLYYLLSGLELYVPPLRERPEDLQYHLESTLKNLYERYARYHVLTQGARKLLLSYEWKGNLFQIESFCERLVLTAQKRSIDELVVRKLMEQLYGVRETSRQAQDLLLQGNDLQQRYPEQAQRILDTLDRNGGNREKTAAQLGISKATLWRHMKKYGIEW